MPQKISPLALAMAKFHNIDLSKIQGTGIQNRIMSTDIFNSNNNVNVGNVSSTSIQEKIIDVTTIRNAIAKAMIVSKNEIPTTVLTFFVDVTKLVNYRKQVKEQVQSTYNLKLSYLPFFVKAVIYAIQKYPIFNSSYIKETNKIHIKGSINFGIAVDTENGLMVPNIKDADKLSIVQIGQKIIELANKARNKQLSLAEIKNGTISLTNFGSINAAWGTPIINYPEVAIVAPGNIEERLSRNESNQIIAKQIMPFTIAADHRWIDGADIGRFMKVIAHHLETLEGLEVK
ncbi:dihydrolipoamide acetyltransferase family protein [Mycoplasmoides pirum]|uniref:dihydrolipoamide acetyltransferase family protein n=1 Tax=Mycoplasmoides pirum TaxID=2122 RepID=UPI000697BDF0|nr:dihydrolipoamide acetyltransferase family protein [Mycoplasmoides pirum]